MQSISRVHLFTVYNAAKSLGVERGRLNRALGIAQRKDTSNPYGCTATRSLCPDGKFRGITCKHSIALAMLATAESL